MATIRSGKWWWLETLKEIDCVVGQEAYQIPNDIRKIVDLYVSVGSSNPTYYAPIPIEDPTRWKEVIMSRLGQSNVPMFYYRDENRVRIQPVPNSTDMTIHLRGRLNLRDLSIADYTTGTIVSIANGATTVTGSGTSWTASMAGRYIKITDGNSANLGDGFWYEISSVTSATVLELVKNYEGTSIAAGSATYTIGQMSPIPESYDLAPVYRSTALYYQKEGEPEIANSYWRLYDGGKEAGLLSEDAPYGGIIGRMMEENGEKVEGAWVQPLSNNLLIDPNVPPQLVSGIS